MCSIFLHVNNGTAQLIDTIAQIACTCQRNVLVPFLKFCSAVVDIPLEVVVRGVDEILPIIAYLTVFEILDASITLLQVAFCLSEQIVEPLVSVVVVELLVVLVMEFASVTGYSVLYRLKVEENVVLVDKNLAILLLGVKVSLDEVKFSTQTLNEHLVEITGGIVVVSPFLSLSHDGFNTVDSLIHFSYSLCNAGVLIHCVQFAVDLGNLALLSEQVGACLIELVNTLVVVSLNGCHVSIELLNLGIVFFNSVEVLLGSLVVLLLNLIDDGFQGNYLIANGEVLQIVNQLWVTIAVQLAVERVEYNLVADTATLTFPGLDVTVLRLEFLLNLVNQRVHRTSLVSYDERVDLVDYVVVVCHKSVERCVHSAVRVKVGLLAS